MCRGILDNFQAILGLAGIATANTLCTHDYRCEARAANPSIPVFVGSLEALPHWGAHALLDEPTSFGQRLYLEVTSDCVKASIC